MTGQSDTVARLNARQEAEDLAYIRDQWGSLYVAFHDHVWVAFPKAEPLGFMTASTANDLLQLVRWHYDGSKRKRGTL